MRKFLLILLFLNNTLFAQVNYINYHKQIVKIEDLFLAGQVKKSLIAYKNIFEEYNKPFAKDCFIALQLACLINDTANATYFFQKAFEQGVSWELTNHSAPVSAVLINNYSYQSKVKSIYAACRAKYWRSLNMPLRKSMVALLNEDGENRKYGGDHRGNKTAIYDKHEEAVDRNIQTLNKLSKIYCIPGEHMVGFMDTDFMGFELRYIWQLRSLPSLIFFHNRCGYPLMKKELMQAVINGEMLPREYALIYSWSYVDTRENIGHYSSEVSHHIVKTPCAFDLEGDIKYYNFFLDQLFYCKDSAIVNHDRWEIGMSSIAHDRKKQAFAKETNTILFFGFLENY